MENVFQLDPLEARLFGVLIEKAMTTPDQYPLTINAAINGANQKSNRDPVLSLSEDDVLIGLERLVQRHLVRKVFLGNSRAEKYSHRGGEMLSLNAAELAIMAELLMRGPQTPGELRTRAARMSPIDSLEQLMVLLPPLIERGFVRRLPPAPGSRAERYVQLMSPDLHPVDVASDASAAAEVIHVPGLAGRVEALESEVRRLRQQLELLAAKLGQPLTE